MTSDYHDLGPLVKEYWAVISGSATALWFAGVRVQRMLFSKFVTHSDLKILHEEIDSKLAKIDQKIETNTDRIMAVLLKHHEAMVSKDGRT